MAGKLGMGLLETLLENLDRDLNLASTTLTNPIITTSAAVTTTGTVSMTGTAVNIPSPDGGGVERVGDAILVVAATTTLVDFSADLSTNRVITMPAATVGRRIRFIWSVTQATTARVLTAAGSDDFTGMIFTSITGNAAGDGDTIAVADGSVSVTFHDDITAGSYVDCHCAVAGAWLITGHLVLDAVSSPPVPA